MLGHNAIGVQPLSSIALGTATPYEIVIDDAAEIEVVTVLELIAYIDPDAV